LNILYFYQC